MKNIGVFINGLNSEYSIEIIDGITDFFRGKDVRLFFTQTRVPHSDAGIYEYQYWSSTVYFNISEIDAIIVVCGEYTSQISIPKLSSALSNYKKIPVISIGQELFLAKNSFTHADCKTAFNEVVSHLKNVHGCRKIAFFSANQTNSEEGLERLEAYKDALKANELFYNRNLVINGKFTDSFAYEEILRKYKSKEDVNFDAIICANDLTAIGCQQALKRLGVKIPEDVKIIGFDDSSKAETVSPKLSTMNQDIFQQGAIAAELTYNILFDKSKLVARTTKTPVNPIYRQSCGCIPMSVQENVYINQHGDTCYKNAEEIRRLKVDGEFFNYLTEIKTTYNLFSLLHSDSTLHDFFYRLRYILENASMTKAVVCLFDEPITLQNRDSFELPRNMNLSMLVDIERNIEIFEPNITFNPRKKIIHDKYFEMDSGSYIFSPVFSGEKNYGYIICKVKNLNFAIYTVFMKIIINAITQAFEYTASLEKNKKLSEENLLLYQNTRSFDVNTKIDTLTKFLNRRGFIELAQQRIDIAIASDCTGLVIYADLDNLTPINDTYGNEVGDEAIKAMSTVLGKVLRANDVVGRISGDKLAAIAVGLSMENLDKIRARIKKECIKISKEKNFEFLLSFSIGATEFTRVNYKLKNLIDEADKAMYLEKDEKHSSTKFEFITEDEEILIQDEKDVE